MTALSASSGDRPLIGTSGRVRWLRCPGGLFHSWRYLFNRCGKAIVPGGDTDYQHGLLGRDVWSFVLKARSRRASSCHGGLTGWIRRPLPVVGASVARFTAARGGAGAALGAATIVHSDRGSQCRSGDAKLPSPEGSRSILRPSTQPLPRLENLPPPRVNQTGGSPIAPVEEGRVDRGLSGSACLGCLVVCRHGETPSRGFAPGGQVEDCRGRRVVVCLIRFGGLGIQVRDRHQGDQRLPVSGDHHRLTTVSDPVNEL